MARHRASALLLALALLAPADASAGAAPAVARLAACDPVERSAIFESDMRAIPGALRLQVRFTLQVRDSGEEGWRRLAVPNFGVWLSAAPGRMRYVYTKRVENLAVAADHRVVVRFRWRSASGEVLARARRVTRACRVPDPRPDLRPLRVRVGFGTTPDTRTYEVLVANRGRSDAPPFAVALEVNGMRLVRSTGRKLAADDHMTVVFDAPPCLPGTRLTAVVDVAEAVEEADETDDVLTVPCPDAARRRR